MTKTLSPVRVLLLRCVQAIQQDYPDAQIILHGSQARGEATPESDIDSGVGAVSGSDPELSVSVAAFGVIGESASRVPVGLAEDRRRR